MASVKGISVVYIKKLFKRYPAIVESTFLSQLPSHLCDLYNHINSDTLTPVETQNQIYIYVAQALFPNEHDKFTLLGTKVAELVYSGVYKIFFKLSQPTFALNRWANIWYLHHDTGTTLTKNQTKNSVDFIIADYPNLPREMRFYIRGHMIKIMELVGFQEYNVQHFEDDCNAWCWHITWGK